MVAVQSVSSLTRDNLERAYHALMRGQYETASGLYGQILEREPKNLPAILGKSASLHKLRRHREARELYERALQIDPGNREALTNLLSIFAQESPREALAQLLQLHRSHSDFSPLAAQIASLSAQLGDLTQALRYQAMAVSLDGENALYAVNLAIIQDRAGMAEEAAQSYEAALTAIGRGATGLPMPESQIRERLRFLRAR
jgi:tetratricopeptide (TPR) repeat protein